MVVQKIKDGEVSGLRCADASCKKMMNDFDIKSLGLEADLLKTYEKLAVENAVA